MKIIKFILLPLFVAICVSGCTKSGSTGLYTAEFVDVPKSECEKLLNEKESNTGVVFVVNGRLQKTCRDTNNLVIISI